MDDESIKSLLSGVPNPFSIHNGLFNSVEEAKYAIRGVLRAYFGDKSSGDDDYLFFRSAVVRFEKDPQIDLDLDHRLRTIIFIIKEPQGANAENIKNQVRKQMQLEYAVMASDIRSRAAMSIYCSLNKKARENIVEIERQRGEEESKSSS